MDAEKFDKVVLDLLYDELDELTRASAIRHTEQSGRAKALYSELRATREVGRMPLVEPPADLEDRIMQAEESARRERPLGQRLGALVSIAASYAMRPELAMAAVLMLMVGSSLLFLRVKPGVPGSSVQVTERGAAESEKEPETVVPVSPPPPPEREDEPRAQSAEGARFGRARTDTKGDYAARPSATQAEKVAQADPFPASPPADDLAPSEASGGPAADGLGAVAAAPAMPGAAAGAAQAEEQPAASSAAQGCGTDLPHYERLIAAPDTSPDALNAARFAAAQCYQRLGRVEAARRNYRLLLSQSQYQDAARRALAVLPEAGGRVAAAPPAAPAKPAARATSRPAASPSP